MPLRSAATGGCRSDIPFLEFIVALAALTGTGAAEQFFLCLNLGPQTGHPVGDTLHVGHDQAGNGGHRQDQRGEVFTTITGAVATSCFGVKGMAARSKKDGLVHLLRSESMAKGVRVIFEEDDTVSIELHIIVDAGVNLTAVSSSIMSEVRYAVGNMTGAQVRAVDVYVDSMEID